MTSKNMENVYNHLRNIGVSTENNLLITTDLTLVTKYNKIIRRIFIILSKHFPSFRHLIRETSLPCVIIAVEVAAIKDLPVEAQDATQKAAFIVSVLRVLERGRDPYLRTLASLNKLSHRIDSSSLSDDQKAEQHSRLQELERLYQEGDTALEQAITNAFSDIEYLETVRVPTQQSILDSKLINCLKTRKNALLLTALLASPYIAMKMAAEPPDRESQIDFEKIKEILAAGADINCRESGTSYTPLIYAAYFGFPNIAAYLLSSGASPELKEQGGYNAYTMAVYCFNKYHELLAQSEQSFCEDALTTADRLRHAQYRDYINRYEQIATLLEPCTVDRTMP